MEMIIRKPYSRVRVSSNIGTDTEPAYNLKRGKNGSELIKTGDIDSYNMIQSHADSVSLDVILAKFTAGDTSVLNKREGVYIDTTSIPSNLHDLYNDISRAEVAFGSLPLSVKESYGNDPVRFFADDNAVATYFGVGRSEDVDTSAASPDAAKDVTGTPVYTPDMKEGEI